MYGELRRGIAEGQLRVHHQPKVSLTTGTVTGVEGLGRWQHPERGLLAPGEFLDAAGHSGLVPALTEVVLDRALSDHAARAAADLVLPVAVNLSARPLGPTACCSVVLPPTWGSTGSGRRTCPRRPAARPTSRHASTSTATARTGSRTSCAAASSRRRTTGRGSSRSPPTSRAPAASTRFQAARDRQRWARPFHDRTTGPFSGVYGRCFAGMAALAELDLDAAQEQLEDAVALARTSAGRRSHESRPAGALLGELQYERGDLEEAERLLEQSRELGAQSGVIDFMLARIKAGRGAATEAAELLGNGAKPAQRALAGALGRAVPAGLWQDVLDADVAPVLDRLLVQARAGAWPDGLDPLPADRPGAVVAAGT